MSEATYTAWDDNLYEWPPPDGWYQADDGKWWPEGYGPAGEPSPAEEANSENSNEALLLEIERTSIFPAGGSGLVGTNQSEDRIEAESQRPVYDELPSIDDVFGGSDPYADESEPASTNGVTAFSGPPPSIDDLPGLSDLGADDAASSAAGDEPEDVSVDVDDDEVVGSAFDLIDTDGDFAADEADAVFDATGDSHADGDELEAIQDLDLDADGEGDPVESDIPDTDIPDTDIPDGDFPGGEPLDDEVPDADLGSDDLADDDLADDDLAGDVSEVDLQDVDADDAFEQIVENYDSTEAPDGDIDHHSDGHGDAEPKADDGFDAARMVSGIHLGELPVEAPDPHATAPVAPMAEGGDRQDSPLPDVGMHMDASPEADADPGAIDEPTMASTTADVEQHHGNIADEDLVYEDSAAIDQLQEESEVAHYGDDHDMEDEPGRRWWPILTVAAAAVVVGGLVLFLLFGRGDDPVGFDVAASLADPNAGSLGEPYSSDSGVVVFYNDDGAGEERRWVIQVIETVSDETDQIVANQGAATPAAGSVLAVSRIRVTYQSGPAPGRASDLLLTSVGSSLTFFDEADACTSAETLDLTTGLDPGQAVEGDVCWEIPAVDLDSLKLAVEAGPVDGVVFMSLNPS